eukprot:2340127-Pyramimonas_sp.AAC.1
MPARSSARFIAGRFLEAKWTARDGKTVFLALDRAKALDSASREALANSLRRIGCPDRFANMVAAIYCSKLAFVVDDFGAAL